MRNEYEYLTLIPDRDICSLSMAKNTELNSAPSDAMAVSVLEDQVLYKCSSMRSIAVDILMKARVKK